MSRPGNARLGARKIRQEPPEHLGRYAVGKLVLNAWAAFMLLKTDRGQGDHYCTLASLANMASHILRARNETPNKDLTALQDALMGLHEFHVEAYRRTPELIWTLEEEDFTPIAKGLKNIERILSRATPQQALDAVEAFTEADETTTDAPSSASALRAAA